jgi:hypothetical protein
MISILIAQANMRQMRLIFYAWGGRGEINQILEFEQSE